MLLKTIFLSSNEKESLHTYLLNPTMNGETLPKCPAIIILPGGAFTFLSDTEAEPVAMTFAREGFHTFVLRYSVGDDSAFPNPLDEEDDLVAMWVPLCSMWLKNLFAEAWDAWLIARNWRFPRV